MLSLKHGIRGTVHRVLGASLHLLWYVSWQTGAASAVRDVTSRRGAG
ncbi:MAG TPA: hypothetical protein VES79_10545 [Solirubrobacteraceae bacterium]|nr:hypothetical protein [Solirubrobacteraceae bacterium]